MTTLNAGTGADGTAVVSVDKNINTDLMTGGRSYADGVGYRVTSMSTNSVGVSATPNGMEAGDTLLLMNVRGQTGNVANVGTYEFIEIDSIVTTTITFTTDIQNNYGDDGGNANISSHRVIVQRIPNYSSFTLNTGVTLTCNAFSPSTGLGGIIAFKCSDTCELVGNIDANYKGYEGGSSSGDQSCYTGGSILAPRFDINGLRNYGGGADGGLYNNQWHGGGGGGYGTVGGSGKGHDFPATTNQGGAVYGVQELYTQLFMGSGGGGGPKSDVNWSIAGDGGGLIYITALTLDILGNINTRGQDSVLNTDVHCAGAASGGSILLVAGTVNTNSSTFSAIGGTPGNDHGGTGGMGRVAVYYQVLNGTFTSSPTPYADPNLELPYSVSGTVSAACAIRIYDSDWNFVKSQVVSEVGSYSVLNLPNAGPFYVIADPDSANSNVEAYKGVSGIQ